MTQEAERGGPAQRQGQPITVAYAARAAVVTAGPRLRRAPFTSARLPSGHRLRPDPQDTPSVPLQVVQTNIVSTLRKLDNGGLGRGFGTFGPFIDHQPLVDPQARPVVPRSAVLARANPS